MKNHNIDNYCLDSNCIFDIVDRMNGLKTTHSNIDIDLLLIVFDMHRNICVIGSLRY